MIVAVWGGSGAGKSTLARRIAQLLSAKRNVLLIDANFIVPQLGVWFPLCNTAERASLSAILRSDITPESLAGEIHLITPSFGVLGYAKGELAMNSILQRSDTAAALLNAASSVADDVVIDCQTNITQDFLTFTALEMAAVRIIVCTPDLPGVSFWLSNIPMLADEKYRIGEAMRVLNKVKDVSPLSAAERQIGSCRYLFPYDGAVETEDLRGAGPDPLPPGVSKRFGLTLRSLVSDIAAQANGSCS